MSMVDELYNIDWKKYANVNSLDKCYSLQSDFFKTYHSCPDLLIKKKQLEAVAKRQSKQNSVVKKHFKTAFRKRKVSFYQTILYDILKDATNDEEKEMVELTKDILYIYSKKNEERHYLEWLINDWDATLEEMDRQNSMNYFCEYDV